MESKWKDLERTSITIIRMIKENKNGIDNAHSLRRIHWENKHSRALRQNGIPQTAQTTKYILLNQDFRSENMLHAFAEMASHAFACKILHSLHSLKFKVKVNVFVHRFLLSIFLLPFNHYFPFSFW